MILNIPWWKHTIQDSLQAWIQSSSIFMKEIMLLQTIENKRNSNTKQHLLQNDQNADTTLLHSQDDL